MQNYHGTIITSSAPSLLISPNLETVGWKSFRGRSGSDFEGFIIRLNKSFIVLAFILVFKFALPFSDTSPEHAATCRTNFVPVPLWNLHRNDPGCVVGAQRQVFLVDEGKRGGELFKEPMFIIGGVFWNMQLVKQGEITWQVWGTGNAFRPEQAAVRGRWCIDSTLVKTAVFVAQSCVERVANEVACQI